jgi:hypothetical protein
MPPAEAPATPGYDGGGDLYACFEPYGPSDAPRAPGAPGDGGPGALGAAREPPGAPAGPGASAAPGASGGAARDGPARRGRPGGLADADASPEGAGYARIGAFLRTSNGALSSFMARALESAGHDRGAAMRANDAHRHLSKYQADALDRLARAAADGGAGALAEADEAVGRFETELEVLSGGRADAPPAPEAPTGEDLESFRKKIRDYNGLDDQERALRASARAKGAEKACLSREILGFMERHGLDDISTSHGTLLCVRRKSKAPLSRSDMAERIRKFFGDDAESAEALRGNLFDGGEERESVSLRRRIPKPPRFA